MNKIKSLFLSALLFAPLAHASFLFDGTNDQLRGTLTTALAGAPITLACWQKNTTHPAAADAIIQAGNSAASNNDSQELRTSGTDDTWQAFSTDNAGASSTAAFTTSAAQYDGVWIGVVAVFTSDNLRDIYVGAIGNTGQSTANRTMADAIDDLALGENLVDGEDFAGRLAHCAVWDVALTTQQITDYLVDNDGVSPDEIDPTNLVGYWPMTTNDLTNVGTDAGGDLTASGNAVFDADNPTFSDPIAFSVGPTEAPAADGHTISGTLTGAGTLTAESVSCNPGDAVPSNAELEAGQCGGGNAARANNSEVWTTGVSNNFLLTSANKPVRSDVYVAGTDGTTDTAVTTLAEQDRTIRTGFLSVVMASHSATGICNEDAYFAPDCADGDVFEYEDDTNESADCNISIAATGELTLTPVAAGDCGGAGIRRTFEISYQDVSNATDGLFTAPTVGNFTTDDTIYVNNVAPTFEDDQVYFLFQKDVAIEASQFDTRWADVEMDNVEVTFSSLPTGLTNTSSLVEGTPTTCQSLSINETATDTPGDATVQAIEMEIGDLVPDVVTGGVDEATTIAAIQAVCSFTAVAGTPEYSGSVAVGDTIRTSPIVGWLSPPDQAVEYILSLGEQQSVPVTDAKVVFVIANLTGLVRWVDYIPVGVVPGCEAGSYEEDGCWATEPLASSSGLTPWVDYTPVGEVAEDADGKWRYENNGWMPVNDLTP